MYPVKDFERTFQKHQEYMKKICYFPFIFDNKRQERKHTHTSKEDKYDEFKKTHTAFSKLHLDSTKQNDGFSRNAFTANKRKYYLYPL